MNHSCSSPSYNNIESIIYENNIQALNESINESINESLNESINESINECRCYPCDNCKHSVCELMNCNCDCCFSYNIDQYSSSKEEDKEDNKEEDKEDNKEEEEKTYNKTLKNKMEYEEFKFEYEMHCGNGYKTPSFISSESAIDFDASTNQISNENSCYASTYITEKSKEENPGIFASFIGNLNNHFSLPEIPDERIPECSINLYDSKYYQQEDDNKIPDESIIDSTHLQ